MRSRALLILAAGLLAAAAPARAQSGLQITPDGKRTLILKDVGAERWAIARFSDHVVTGIAYRVGYAPSFVWCKQIGVSDGSFDLACSVADSCKAGPCRADQWVDYVDVEVRESFFAPPQGQPITPDDAASLELAWDFPVAGGVTASPVATDDLVYVGSWDGNLYALDRQTGAQWSFAVVPGFIGVHATGRSPRTPSAALHAALLPSVRRPTPRDGSRGRPARGRTRVVRGARRNREIGTR